MKKIIGIFYFCITVVLTLYSQDLFPYQDEWKKDTYGYIDRNGKIINQSCHLLKAWQ